MILSNVTSCQIHQLHKTTWINQQLWKSQIKLGHHAKSIEVRLTGKQGSNVYTEALAKHTWAKFWFCRHHLLKICTLVSIEEKKIRQIICCLFCYHTRPNFRRKLLALGNWSTHISESSLACSMLPFFSFFQYCCFLVLQNFKKKEENIKGFIWFLILANGCYSQVSNSRLCCARIQGLLPLSLHQNSAGWHVR